MASSGGFVLSPPASSIASHSTTSSTLPHPRDSPLRPGGSKESTFIRHVDDKILRIQRRFAKRTTPLPSGEEPERDAVAIWDSVEGYKTMSEACKDMEDLIGVIWVSGTPSLQIPYLLNLGSVMSHVIQGMPANPKQMFRVLGKLDHAFVSLLEGRDVDTAERLPGFEGKRGVSGTEKVRIRSLITRTRTAVVDSLKSPDVEEVEGVESEDEDKMDTGDERSESGELILEGDETYEPGDDESWDMMIARVYDRTMVELGESMEEPSIGILTEGRG